MIWILKLVCTAGWGIVRGWHALVGHPEDRVVMKAWKDGSFRLKCLSCGAERVHHLRKTLRSTPPWSR